MYNTRVKACQLGPGCLQAPALDVLLAQLNIALL